MSFVPLKLVAIVIVYYYENGIIKIEHGGNGLSSLHLFVSFVYFNCVVGFRCKPMVRQELWNLLRRNSNMNAWNLISSGHFRCYLFKIKSRQLCIWNGMFLCFLLSFYSNFLEWVSTKFQMNCCNGFEDSMRKFLQIFNFTNCSDYV